MFRRVFVRWGLPDALRVDNGYPWGSSRDLPSELALWLIGLGVEPIWIPPGQPTCNPKVERCNGITQQWGELHTCTDLKQAARALAWVCQVQRQEYPAIRGCTRAEVFPQLSTPRRVYRRADERLVWDLARVHGFLARGCWRRHADGNGVISLYGHGHSVGRCWARRELVVRFDAATRCWLVSDPGGKLIKELPASQLTRKRILKLAVSRRR